MKKILSVAIALMPLSLLAIDCSNTGDIKEHNGHYYAITSNAITFETARIAAQNEGGYLAIPNTAAENEFMKNILGKGQIAWIGIHDPSKMTNYCYDGAPCSYSDSRFRTIENTTLSYRNWGSTQPNNLVKDNDIINGRALVSPLGEHWVAMNGNNGLWLDEGNHAESNNNPIVYKAIFEFNTKPQCFFEDDVNSSVDLTSKKCNTQIYDNTISELTIGNTYDCQQDQYGTDFCPSALADCAQDWDYQDGYSTSGIGQVVDYTNKVLTQTSVDCSYPATKVSSSYQANIGSDPSKLGFNFVYAQTIGCGSVANSTQDDNHINGFKGVLTGSLSSVPPNTKVSLPFTIANNQIQLCPYVPYGNPQAVTWSSISSAQKQAVIDSAVAGAPTNSSEYAYYFWEANGQGYAGQTSASTNPIFDSGTCTISFYNTVRGKAVFYNACSFSCPNGGTLSGNICTTYQYSCPNGGTLSGDKCIKSCDTVNYVCDNGYTATTGAETAKGECKKTIEYTYYNYLCSSGYTATNSGGNCNKTDPNNTTVNSTTLDDACNSSTPPANNCKKEAWKCQEAPDRKCAWVDNMWQCSPFPCIGESNINDLSASVGTSDKNNEGWSSDGNCNGQMYLFSGKSNKCRSWDQFGGLVGGGCCDKDKVFLGLVSCKAEEKQLASKNKSGMCHEIGEFCSKEVDLLLATVCVEKSISHCCFNSKFARILQEQGRPQLGISWGNPKNPICRGFTPQEFQKLDMSQMNLDEFVNSIVLPDMTQISNTVQNKVQNHLDALSTP